MPGNTTTPNPGVSVEFQNPSTNSLVLDAEAVGNDSSTGVQLTREFVVPVESISGTSSLERIADLLGQLIIEVKRMRNLMEQEAVPEMVDEVDEAAPASDESETEESQGN